MARQRRRGTAAIRRRAALAAPTLALTVSLEAPLWAALIGLAAALRLANLDSLPLSISEGVHSYGAWLVSQGTVPQGWPGDATAAITTYVFRIFGAGDVGARIVPALAGSGAVALLWFAAPYVGRGGAFLAAALIAFSPMAVHLSRSPSPFALGGLLSLAMVLALLAYLRQGQPWQVALLAVAFALGLASDPIAVSTAIAVAAFLALELAWRGSQPLREALATFRGRRDHWLAAAVALVVTFILGLTRFGTDIDRLSLPGLRLWADMFELPRDDFPWHYQLGLLLGYEWPLLLAGVAGLGLLLYRLAQGQPLSLFQRLLLIWAAVAVIVVALATRREAGQLLLLLLPFALLAGTTVEDVISDVDWGVLRRWWPALALALGLIAYGLVQLSEWSQDGGLVTAAEKGYMVMAFLAAATLMAAGFAYLGRHGLALALPLATALALPFLLHSSLSVAFGHGSEYIADSRIGERMAIFRESVVPLAERAGQPVTVDPQLGEALAWYLRETKVVFGDPPPGSPLIGPPLATPPRGYAPQSEPWLLAQRWYPSGFPILPAWRWLAYRQPYGNVSNVEAQIYIPTP